MRPFRAARAAGEDLARVEQTLGVEGAAQALHGGEVGGRVQLPHHRALLDPHPVLPGDGAAEADAHAQDLVRRIERPLLRRRIVGIEQDVRVEVAVAGMEYIAGLEPALLR